MLTPDVIPMETPFVAFQKNNPIKKELDALAISLDEDLYSELLTSVKWKTKKK